MSAIKFTDDNTGRIMLIDRNRIVGLTQDDGRTVVLFGVGDVEMDGVFVSETLPEAFAMWQCDFRPSSATLPLITKTMIAPAFLAACKAALPDVK